jgi:type VI secretion system protein ImpE
MNHTSLLREARVEEALVAVKDEIRKAPLRVELRVTLFALHCVLGQLDKAEADLDVIKKLDASWTLPAQVYQSLLVAELLRRDIFAARAKPLVMGAPEPWVGWNVQALALEAAGDFPAAVALRKQAWEAAPEYACTVDGRACRWLGDVDRRIGTVLEAILDGKYYWIPLGQLRKIEVTPPEFLVEVVWLPAKLTLQGGAELSGHLPARYPGTESSSDGKLCLGQLTSWQHLAEGNSRPLGQKMFESEIEQFGLLGCKIVEFASHPTS